MSYAAAMRGPQLCHSGLSWTASNDLRTVTSCVTPLIDTPWNTRPAGKYLLSGLV